MQLPVRLVMQLRPVMQLPRLVLGRAHKKIESDVARRSLLLLRLTLWRS